MIFTHCVAQSAGEVSPARRVAVSMILVSAEVPGHSPVRALTLDDSTGVPFPRAAAARLRGGDSARILDTLAIRWSHDTGSNAPDRTLSPSPVPL